MENEVKEPAPKYNYISPEEYLAMERASDEKHEYYNGHIITLGGASLTHNRIAINLYTEIDQYLIEGNCEILPSEMRVSTPGKDAYLYPDATIVCGKPELQDDKFDTLLNPSVVVEILSPSTRGQDLGYKFTYYKSILSLKEYILIDSQKRFAQVMRKQDDTWVAEELVQADSSIFIRTIDFSLSFDAIYRNTGL